MLEVADLAVEIQSSEILRGVSFEIAAGELVCLVGRNGAGKTTTLRTVMGYLAPRRGVIRLAGADLTGKSTLDRARLGIGYSPEDSEVLGELTVAENIELPTWTRRTEKPASERIESRLSGLSQSSPLRGTARNTLVGRGTQDAVDCPHTGARREVCCFWTSRSKACRRQ